MFRNALSLLPLLLFASAPLHAQTLPNETAINEAIEAACGKVTASQLLGMSLRYLWTDAKGAQISQLIVADC